MRQPCPGPVGGHVCRLRLVSPRLTHRPASPWGSGPETGSVGPSGGLPTHCLILSKSLWKFVELRFCQTWRRPLSSAAVAGLREGNVAESPTRGPRRPPSGSRPEATCACGFSVSLLHRKHGQMSTSVRTSAPERVRRRRLHAINGRFLLLGDRLSAAGSGLAPSSAFAPEDHGAMGRTALLPPEKKAPGGTTPKESGWKQDLGNPVLNFT